MGLSELRGNGEGADLAGRLNGGWPWRHTIRRWQEGSEGESMSEWVSVAEAATSARIDGRKARRLVLLGKVERIRLGWTWGVRPDAFEEFKKDGRRKRPVK